MARKVIPFKRNHKSTITFPTSVIVTTCKLKTNSTLIKTPHGMVRRIITEPRLWAMIEERY